MMLYTCECDNGNSFCRKCSWGHKRRSCYGHFANEEEAVKYDALKNVCFICSGELDASNTAENEKPYPCCSLECAIFQQTTYVGLRDASWLNDCAIRHRKELSDAAIYYLTKVWDECWESKGHIIFNGIIYPARKAAMLVRYGKPGAAIGSENGSTSIIVEHCHFECPLALECINPSHFKSQSSF